MKPFLNYLIASEYAGISAGKASIDGAFNRVNASKVPLYYGRAYFTFEVLELNPGEYTCSFLVTSPKGAEVLSKEIPFKVLKGQLGITLVVNASNLTFVEFGDYTMQVAIDGEKCGDRTFSVRNNEGQGS